MTAQVTVAHTQAQMQVLGRGLLQECARMTLWPQASQESTDGTVHRLERAVWQDRGRTVRRYSLIPQLTDL